jgi:hypothetical protein
MDESHGAIWFFGDLHDPWVMSIADTLPAPAGVVRFDCTGEPPRQPFDADRPPRLIVVHRQRLDARDADRLKEWRTQGVSENAPSLILCVGPYVRYEELERYSGLVDLVLSEATAVDVLARHAARMLDGRQARVPIGSECGLLRLVVATASGELCRTIAEACAAAGYRAEQAGDHVVGATNARARSGNEPGSAGERVLTIWDVPVLEEWMERLERHVRQTGPVVALMGFPDRTMVAFAKSKGAVACLELPLNLDDLIDVIDRFARTTPKESPAVTTWGEPPHLLPPRSRRRSAARKNRAQETQWPVHGMPPTIGRTQKGDS